jgi:hypothetical protein
MNITHSVRRKLYRCFFCILMCGLAFNCTLSRVVAQTHLTPHTLEASDKPQGEFDLTELNWLVGRWVGSGLGGECEEVFLPVWHNTMTGSFRFAKNDKLVFSEYFSIVRLPTGVELRLKHFNPNLSSWEEKDDSTVFRFVRSEKDAVYFRGLTYKLEEKDKLKVWVAMKNTQTGEYKEEMFDFRRQK